MSQHSSSATPSIARGVLAGLVIMVLLLCFAGLAILTFDVRRAVVAQATASSDNTQWTLSQVDVEYLSLSRAPQDISLPGWARNQTHDLLEPPTTGQMNPWMN